MPVHRISRLFFVLTALMIASDGSLKLAAQNFSLVVGLDGLNAYGIHAANTPNLDSLINGTFGGGAYHGAYAQHSYTGGELGTPTQQTTVSGPGWSSMLTGVWANKHGVTDNGFGGRNFASHPTYLETLEKNVTSLYSASAVTWSPIDNYVISSVNDLRTSMDFRTGGSSDASNTTTIVNQIAGLSTSNSAAIFVGLDDVDGAGHSTGSYSAGYLGQVADVDSQLGRMLTAIQNRSNFANENWQVVVTADHGHTPRGGHGGQSGLERSIPVIISSKNVVQGFVPTTGHATSLVDVAPTVLDHFGLAAPNNYEGQVLGGTALSISTSSRINDGLVSHLAFDGNAAAGLAGAGGIAEGNVQFAAGKFGLAATVENYGDGFIRLNDDLGAGFGVNTDFSMSMWMKYNSYAGDAAFFSNKDWNSGNNTGINLGFDAGNALDINAKGASGGRQDASPLAGLTPGEWQNIVFTVDRNGLTNMFIDGTMVSSFNSSAGSFDGLSNWVFLNDGTGDYTFGGSSADGLMIDEFAAWNRVLSLDEVSMLSQTNLTSVPEPGCLIVLALGGGMVVWVRRR